MLISALVYCVFLNFTKANLTTNLLIEKIDKFGNEYKHDVDKFSQRMGLDIDIKKAFEQKKFDKFGNRFILVIQKIINLREKIPDIKEKMTKFLEDKNDKTFKQVDMMLNHLKLEKTMIMKLEASKSQFERLKQLETGENATHKEHQNDENINKETDELKEEIIKLIKKANLFLFDINLWVNLLKLRLSSELKKDQKILKVYFAAYANENKAFAFDKIFKLMKKEKAELRKSIGKSEMSAMEKRKVEENLPRELVKNDSNLRNAMTDEYPLFELHELEGAHKIDTKIYNQLENMWELINEKVEEFPNVLMADDYFKRKDQVYSKSRDLELLNNACLKTLKIMDILFEGKITEMEKNCFLADIKWLADFIMEQKQKIGQNEIANLYHNELSVNHFDEKSIIENAEKLLSSIFKKMKEIHNFENIIHSITNIVKTEEKGKQKIKDLLMKESVPKNVGLFFYGKYVEEKKEEMASKNVENTKDDEKMVKKNVGTSKIQQKEEEKNADIHSSRP